MNVRSVVGEVARAELLEKILSYHFDIDIEKENEKYEQSQKKSKKIISQNGYEKVIVEPPNKIAAAMQIYPKYLSSH